MSMFRGIVLSLSAAAMLPGAAWAEQGARGSTADQANIVSQRALRTYAMCLARSRPRAAEDLLAMPYLSDDQTRRTLERMGEFDTCMGNTDLAQASRAPSLLEGMAIQMLQNRLAGASLTLVSGLTDDQVVTRGLRPRNGYEDFSLCMVRTQPALVRSFVMAEPGTSEEQASFRQVVPHVASCVGEGQHLSLDRPGLRAVLAVGLYRALDVLQPRT